MLIIAGHLVVDAADRDDYVASSIPIVRAAHAAPGCLAFAITADTVDPERVLVFERWESEEQLLEFRGAGPDVGQQATVRDAEVRRYVIGDVTDP